MSGDAPVVRGAGLRWSWLAAAVVIADQITKAVAMAMLEPHAPVAVLPGVNLMLTFNTGAAFSFLADAGGWQRWLFVGLAFAVAVFIVHWLWTLPAGRRLEGAALGLVLGGALGNLWDRLLTGRVVDFIDLYYGRAHWPAFNVADSAIVVGAILIAWESIFARNSGSTDAGR